MDYSKIRLLSFDCYGTLIDWRKSVLDILEPFFKEHTISFSRDRLFTAFLEADRRLTGAAYIPYREILAEIVRLMSTDLQVSIPPRSRYILSEKFDRWLPFPDTVESLRVLKDHYKLAILSNVDDDLFSITRELLGVDFDFVVTAGQLRSYKPSHENFIRAQEKFGMELEEILHVAQSVFHDIRPSNKLGWNNVWLNRYKESERTDPMEFPDLEVPDLESLVRILKIETTGTSGRRSDD
jgi:2-haloacid dehalogenase